MEKKNGFVLLCILLLSVSNSRAQIPLNDWLPLQEAKSWRRLELHISPKEPKTEGGPRPLRGIVVAALSKKNPDYYFHWIRDSATVMRSVLDLSLRRRDLISANERARLFDDFLTLSRRLQQTPSVEGLGEPRFNVDGTPDTLPWSRPQYDGPALRALATLDNLEILDHEPHVESRVALALNSLRTDLNAITRVWNKRGFDVWEEYKAENYHTRLVQLAALERGSRFLMRHRLLEEERRRYDVISQKLATVLDDHWDPARGFLRSQLAIVATDGYTAKKTDLDAAVIVAVAEADRINGPHSVLDDRVHATVNVLENLFIRLFPLNRRTGLGLAYGRYDGDVYYGGNPFVLVTAAFARFYFQLTKKLEEGADFEVTARNLAFVRSLTPSLGWHQPMTLKVGHPLHAAIKIACFNRGNDILVLLQTISSEDGRLPEQFDKVTGAPTSASDLGWSHSAFLMAMSARSALMSARAR